MPFVADLDAMIDQFHLDIALVTLPNVGVADAVTRLADAGVHLLVDKPGGIDATSAARHMVCPRDGESELPADSCGGMVVDGSRRKR